MSHLWQNHLTVPWTPELEEGGQGSLSMEVLIMCCPPALCPNRTQHGLIKFLVGHWDNPQVGRL